MRPPERTSISSGGYSWAISVRCCSGRPDSFSPRGGVRFSRSSALRRSGSRLSAYKQEVSVQKLAIFFVVPVALVCAAFAQEPGRVRGGPVGGGEMGGARGPPVVSPEVPPDRT